MHLFSTEKIAHEEIKEERRCRCGAQLRLVRKMLDPRKGRTIRVFECECGERTWDNLTAS
jgi:hypothetical protein